MQSLSPYLLSDLFQVLDCSDLRCHVVIGPNTGELELSHFLLDRPFLIEAMDVKFSAVSVKLLAPDALFDVVECVFL